MYKVMHPKGMNETFARAFNSRDLRNLLCLYEPGAKLCTDGTGTVLGDEARIAAALEQLLLLPGTMVSRNHFCIEHGDIALLRADWRLLDTAGTSVACGSSCEVARRQADGSWRYVIDH
ncbi:hypothetical protein P3W85_34555, partial [Cupriavidus basilensis]